jgi:hypothetical protein
MPKKLAFDNYKITKLARRYKRHPNLRRRNRLLKKILPLVEAALIKRHVPEDMQDDVRQECVMKLITTAIPGYNPDYANAFAFFWTAICNTISTQINKFVPVTVSLTADNSASSDVEITGADVFQTPENQHILNRIATAIDSAFSQNGSNHPNSKKHKRVLSIVEKSIQSGDFFWNRRETIKRLKKLGLCQSEIQYYISYTLIKIRQQLLDAKGELDILIPSQAERYIP